MDKSIEHAAKNAFNSSIQIRELKLWQDQCHWIESNPNIKGDQLVCLTLQGEKETLIGGEYAIGNQVHEYGGGDFAVHHNGDIYFIRQKDQQIYCLERHTKSIKKITTGKTYKRYADIDLSYDALISIREVHNWPNIINSIITIDLKTHEEKVVAEGHDFYACPRFSSDGTQWAYLYWDHPNMPWNQCLLCYGKWSSKSAMTTINHSKSDVISQFCWTPENQLFYTSDHSGWSNMYINDKAIFASDMHFGFERWQQGQQNIAITKSGIVIAIAGPPEKRVLGRMLGNEWLPFELPCCDFLPFIATCDDKVYVLGAFSDCPPKILCIDLMTQDWSIIQENDINQNLDAVIKAKHIQFPTLDGEKAHAFFYHAKKNNTTTEQSPLLVLCHGGPTASTSPQWDPMIQFWVGQGISVVDVNYRGSTGYGRKYQDALKHKWGIIDVEDCIAARDFLVKNGLINPEKCFIRGKSSGGLTTLRALMWKDKFSAGGCYYGVSDLTQLLSITHKFEQYYLDFLIGPYPKYKKRYEILSPSNSVNRIKAPVIFFHGLLDKVVPPSQTTLMIDALKSRNILCEYISFKNEKHGFKDLKNKINALIKEYQFYMRK